MTVERPNWKVELDELLSVCERRSDRAKEFPHCAICARYSAASPAFEGILSLLETLPATYLSQALGIASERLVKVPPSQRSQQVTTANFGPLLNSPGWTLVGSLIIDMVNEDTARWLTHPGLARIEELTLLGFAYGNAVAGSSFTQALLDSNLTNVRALTLHSTDLGDEDRTAFWSSPFAARLELIEGVAYRGEGLPHTLGAKKIELSGAWDAVESFDYLLKLIAPETTPHLQKLTLGSYYAEGAAPAMLDFLEKHRGEFERIPELEIAIYGQHTTMQEKLRSIRWPKSMVKISWAWHSTHGTIFGFDGDTHMLYRPDSGEGVAGYDTVTHYSNLAVELANVGDMSHSLRELKLIAPPTAAPGDIIAAVGRFEHLNRLCIVYPFDEAQLAHFLSAVTNINQVEIYLTMKTGCFTTQYRQDREEGYQSDASPRFLLKTALSRPHLSIYSDGLDVSRTPSGFEHLTVKTQEAVRELANFDPGEPIEGLTIETMISVREAKALANSKLLGHVYSLNIEEGFSDEAALILADCPQLLGVRILRLTGFKKITSNGFTALFRSPYLTGVLDLILWTVPDGCDETLAAAPVLPRLVNLDLSDNRDSDVLPASGRLRSLRRVSEGLSMSFLHDGRLARKWLNAGTALPLRSRLQHFVDWVYRIPRESLEELISQLGGCESEEDFKECVRDVVAKAFHGTPIPDGASFVDLTSAQQAAIQAIIKVEDHFWCGGDFSEVLESYGLPRWGKEPLERYMAGKDIWGCGEESAEDEET